MDVGKIGDLTIYKMLADDTKLKILKILSGSEKCVSDIISETGASQTLISHKLKDLRENGLVSSFRSGKNIVYRISHESVVSLLNVGEETGRNIRKICDCVECENDLQGT